MIKNLQKYENTTSTFHFDRYFCEKNHCKTITSSISNTITKPLLAASPMKLGKSGITTKKNMTLDKVKEYVSKELDPAKVNFCDNT